MNAEGIVMITIIQDAINNLCGETEAVKDVVLGRRTILTQTVEIL